MPVTDDDVSATPFFREHDAAAVQRFQSLSVQDVRATAERPHGTVDVQHLVNTGQDLVDVVRDIECRQLAVGMQPPYELNDSRPLATSTAEVGSSSNRICGS